MSDNELDELKKELDEALEISKSGSASSEGTAKVNATLNKAEKVLDKVFGFGKPKSPGTPKKK